MFKQTFDGRIPRDRADRTVRDLCTAFADLYTRIEICGSIRRDVPAVKDADLVIIPADVDRFLARLDKLIIDGAISQQTKSNGTVRWGKRYRAVTYQDFPVEIYLADEHNIGYQMLLRTGPATANEYTMQRLMPASGFIARSGYIWSAGRKVSVPDEQTMFRILRIPYVSSHARSARQYETLARHPLPRCQTAQFVPQPDDDRPAQTSLF